MLRNLVEAPDFELSTHDEKKIKLSDLRGKPVVLLFFRGQFCPTSRKFLINYQDFYQRITELGVELLAISRDLPAVSAEMRERYSIKFPLLSDPDLAIATKYETYVDQRKDGSFYTEPALIIVDAEGKVAYSVISSGSKGLPSVEDIAGILIYMSTHQGKY